MLCLTLKYKIKKLFGYLLKGNLALHIPYYRLLLLGYTFTILTLFSTYALADYAATADSANSGYLIELTNDKGIIGTPKKGSDGKNYYQIGNAVSINGSGPLVNITGTATCKGKIWGRGSEYLPSDNAFHRLFMYAPLTGITISGNNPVYRINNNIVMLVRSNMFNWLNKKAAVCSNFGRDVVVGISEFTVQFPISVEFYMNEKIIDNQIVIAGMDLGGYVRAFTSSGTEPPYNSWPIGESTAPLRLAPSVLSVASSCNTMTSTGQASTVNLRHGQLNSLNYDSLVTERVTYTCQFSESTSVRLRLDYLTDDDPKKRLPMVDINNSNNKIYSELKITDEITGQSGTDFKVNIRDLKTIIVSSHIQGNNAVAGDYSGSAWLIATFD